jgi:hypothetical protein
MAKLIIQGKKTGTKTASSVCSAKVLDLFFWCPILVLALGILGFVGKGAAPIVGSLQGRQVEFFFFYFLWFYRPSAIICYKWEL